MKQIIDIILRLGESAGPQQKTTLNLPTDEVMSRIFNTPFQAEDSISVETDGYTVTVNLIGNGFSMQEDLDAGIAASLARHLSVNL